MTAENFVYWLQGFLEISEKDVLGTSLTINQVECVKNNIKLVLDQKAFTGPGYLTVKLGTSPFPGTTTSQC